MVYRVNGLDRVDGEFIYENGYNLKTCVLRSVGYI